MKIGTWVLKNTLCVRSSRRRKRCRRDRNRKNKIYKFLRISPQSVLLNYKTYGKTSAKIKKLRNYNKQ